MNNRLLKQKYKFINDKSYKINPTTLKVQQAGMSIIMNKYKA